MATQTIRSGSDAKFRLNFTDADGNAMQPKDCDFIISFFTARSNKVTVAHRAGDAMPAGMSVDGNTLVIALDRPNFAPGNLRMIVTTRIEDADFPDKYYNVSSGEIETGIEVLQ